RAGDHADDAVVPRIHSQGRAFVVALEPFVRGEDYVFTVFADRPVPVFAVNLGPAGGAERFTAVGTEERTDQGVLPFFFAFFLLGFGLGQAVFQLGFALFPVSRRAVGDPHQFARRKVVAVDRCAGTRVTGVLQWPGGREDEIVPVRRRLGVPF